MITISHVAGNTTQKWKGGMWLRACQLLQKQIAWKRKSDIGATGDYETILGSHAQ